MPLNKSHKEATRHKIIEAASILFRKHGYEGVGIAGIMAEAGLTRGGFYAHFRSKASLFREVLRSRTGLVARLRDREAGSSIKPVVRGYLNSENMRQSLEECTLAALSSDASKADAITQQAYTKVFKNLLAELRAEPGLDDEQEVMLTAVLAVGGLMLAGALSDKTMARQLLEVCQGEIGRKIS